MASSTIASTIDKHQTHRTERPKFKSDKIMSITGMVLDVSQSMRNKIGKNTGTCETMGSWTRPIYEVIDYHYFAENDTKNRVFTIGVGALVASQSKEIFDVIGTVERITQ